MISFAKAISHGAKLIDYITGQAKSKKAHHELIFHLKNNLMAEHLDSSAIWQSLKLMSNRFKRTKNNIIRIQVSPSPEHTRDFTQQDWVQLWDDFAAEFDNYEHRGKGGKLLSGKTNIQGSAYTLWLHKDSKSGVPHLHCAVCRYDKDGNINNDHCIDARAQHAAQAVAIKRGWVTAAKVREKHLAQVTQDCYDILRKMPRWDWDVYFQELKQLGYDVHRNVDQQNKVHGYSLRKGNAKYKASELGKGRDLTARKVALTWILLHQKSVAQVAATPVAPPRRVSVQPVVTPVEQPVVTREEAPMVDYSQPRDGHLPMDIKHNGESGHYYVPEVAKKVWNDEFNYRDVANWNELTNMAAAIFVGLLLPQTTPDSAGGGGTSNDLPWRDKDDDDEQWARRCADAATMKLTKKQKRGGRRR